MTEDTHRIRIELTPEQQSQLKEAGGRDVVAFEFTAEELEQRIVPSSFGEIVISKPIDSSSTQLF
jgi:hypothetical protein